MAFDRPIEADRVNDSNLISSFVRAPITGPIMWVLNGLLSENKENNKSLTTIAEGKGNASENGSSHSSVDSLNDLEAKNALHDNSNTISNSLRRINSNCQTLSRIRSVSSTLGEEEGMLVKKKNRKMSWSDESGQDLVQYYDESNKSDDGDDSSDSSKHQLKASRKPIIKSAMRSSTRRTIPNMPSNGKGIPSNAKNGYISPQWGWYISTTPPTPEYEYYSQNQVLSQNMNNSQSAMSKKPWNPSTAPIQEVSPKPVFSKRAPQYNGDWPTVPL